jgi:DNA-binding winged helix-turn-helix (wHTH) protein
VHSVFKFADFELDQDAYALRQAGRALSLERIPLDLLFLLVERRGSLVSRKEILDRVWGNSVFVDEQNAVNTAVRKLRRALNDDPRRPRFVVTVPTKGYRFVASVAALNSDGAKSKARENLSSYQIAQASELPMVGRERELAQLGEYFARANGGKRQIVFVTGEAGIGKTTVVESFLSSLASEEQILIGRGQCIEQYGTGEPYMPVLEALARLGQ